MLEDPVRVLKVKPAIGNSFLLIYTKETTSDALKSALHNHNEETTLEQFVSAVVPVIGTNSTALFVPGFQG